MKTLILALKAGFQRQQLTVVFHHSLNREAFEKAYPPQIRFFLKRHAQFAAWLTAQGIDYLDVSGGEARLVQHYNQCDLHIGYRVHAHSFMASISKPTVLLIEDGRGQALKEVIGGLAFGADRWMAQDVLEHVRYERTNRLNGASGQETLTELIPSLGATYEEKGLRSAAAFKSPSRCAISPKAWSTLQKRHYATRETKFPPTSRRTLKKRSRN